jgi:uncharacterized cupin superfamily protein
MNSKQNKLGRRELLQIIPIASGLVAGAGVAGRAFAAETAQPKPADAIVPVDKTVALGPYQPMSSMAVAGQPVIKGASKEFYQAGKGAFSVGVWEGEPGVVQIESYPHDECWNLLSGEVTFTNGAGKSQKFSAGDVFVLPKGYKGRVEVHSKLRKNYISFTAPRS